MLIIFYAFLDLNIFTSKNLTTIETALRWTLTMMSPPQFRPDLLMLSNCFICLISTIICFASYKAPMDDIHLYFTLPKFGASLFIYFIFRFCPQWFVEQELVQSLLLDEPVILCHFSRKKVCTKYHQDC